MTREPIEEIGPRVDGLLEKCERRGTASLADVESLRNTVHRLLESVATLRDGLEHTRSTLHHNLKRADELAAEIKHLRAQISDIQRLCDEYAESEEKGLTPRGQHFVSWVRQALAVTR